jgi:hypothetical protein
VDLHGCGRAAAAFNRYGLTVDAIASKALALVQ